jgi:hypothetical protein
VIGRLTGSPEPCTRQGAIDAGWRLAGAQCSGEAMVLQHSGADGNRWQLRAHSFELGRAVEAYKQHREHVVRGAIALWHRGRLNRFEAGADLHQLDAV